MDAAVSSAVVSGAPHCDLAALPGMTSAAAPRPSRWGPRRLAWPLAAALIAMASLAGWLAILGAASRLFR